MHIKNFEFKAHVDALEKYENLSLNIHPELIGTDQQTDTYFNMPKCRLKLREGNLENALINYARDNTAAAKVSQIVLYQHNPNKALKEILTLQLGIKIKIRKIYMINNVKFHFDFVDNLGSFIEVEAIDTKEEFSTTELKGICHKYFTFFVFSQKDLID